MGTADGQNLHSDTATVSRWTVGVSSQGWSSPEGHRGSTVSPLGPMEGEMRGLGLSASCGGARVTGLAGGGGVRGGPVSALARKKPKPRDDAATPPRKRRSCPPAKTEGFNLRQSVCKSVPFRPQARGESESIRPRAARQKAKSTKDYGTERYRLGKSSSICVGCAPPGSAMVPKNA